MAENFQTTFSINDQMTAPLKNITKQLQKLSDLTETVVSGLEELNDVSLDGLNSALDTLDDSLGEVDSATSDVQSSLNHISSGSLNQVTSEVESLHSSLQHVESQANSTEADLDSIDSVSLSGVSSSANHVTSSLNDIESEAQSAADALNNIGNADVTPEGIDGVSGLLQGLTQSLDFSNMMNVAELAATAAQAVAEIGASAMDAAETYTDSLNSIKMGLGATEEEAVKFQNIARNVFTSGFGDSIGDVTDQLVYMKQLLGNMVSDSDLEELLPTFMSLEDSGMDFQESLRATKNLMIGFGVDAQTAADYLSEGMQRGLNFSDELGDNLAEYSARWGEAGVSLGNYFSLLEAGAQSGAYQLDKVGDFLNEFLTSLNDGRMDEALGSLSTGTQDVFNSFKAGQATAQDVLNAVIGDMQNMTSETERAALASSLWSSLGEDNAMGMIMAMGGVTDSYGDVSQAAEELTASNSNSVTQLKNMWNDFKDSTLARVGESIASAALKIIEAMQPVFDFFRNHQGILTTIKALLIGIGAAAAVFAAFVGVPAILGALSAAAGVLTGALGALWAVMIANPVGLVVAAVAGLVAAFVYAWNNSETFRNIVISVWEAVKGAFLTAWENIKGVFASLGQAWNDAIATVQNFWSNLTATVSGWYNDANNWARNIILGFKNGLIAEWEGIKNWFTEKWNWVVDHVKGIFQIGSPSKVFEGIGGDLLLGFKSGLEINWGTVTSWFSSAWESLKNTAKDWGSKIAGFFGFGGDTEDQQLTVQPGIDYTDTINKVNEQMEVLKQSVNAAFAQITQQAYSSAQAMATQTIGVYQSLGLQIAAQTGVTAQMVNQQFLLIDLSPLGAKLNNEMALLLTTLSTLTVQFISNLNVQIQTALAPMITTFSEMFTMIISNAMMNLSLLSTQMIQKLSELSTQSIITANQMSVGMLATIQLMVAEIINQLTVLKDTAALIVSEMTTLITTNINTFKVNVINIITIFKNEFINIWRILSTETLKVLNAFIQQAIQAIQEMVKAITNEVNKLPGVFREAATNAMLSFIDGIRSQTQGAINATNELVQKVKEAFVKGLGIHSPSDITYWYGQMTGKGFIEGLSDSQLAQFAKTYLNEIVDAFLEGKFSADEMVDFLGEDSLKVIHAIQDDPDLLKKAMTAMPGGGGDIVNIARSFVGYRSPWGSSNSQFNQWLGLGGGAWCAMFVKYCADQAGVYFPPIYGVPSIKRWAINNGRWEHTPHVGDAVIFGGGDGHHIEIVSSVLPNGKITSIGGNTWDSSGRPGVYEMSRNGDINGFVHLDGSGTASTAFTSGSDTIGYPLPSRVPVTSRFGGRPSPGGIGSRDHKGVDLGATMGTPILSALNGTVKSAGMSDGYGNLVTVTTGDLDILYGHMSKILTSAGQTVNKGQQIGLVGSTGNSTGPHLHFEMRRNGQAFDPLPYLEGASVSVGAGGGGYGRNLLEQIQDAYNRKYGTFASSSGVSANYNPAAGVSQWTSLVQQALMMLGQPLSYTDDILYAIEHESSGNPDPADYHDSNYYAGHPSKGLMQTIPETFEAYRNPSLSNNILDPLANIYAGINYMIHRYGSIANCVNPRRASRGGWYGYAVGTRYVPQDMLTMIHEGEAILPAGQNPYSQSGGDYLAEIAGKMVESQTNNYSEYITQPNETGAVVVSVGNINTTVNVSGDQAGDPQAIANAVADEIMNRLRVKMATKGGPKIEY